MNNTETAVATGGEWWKQNFPTYPEAFEVDIRRMIMSNIDKEIRSDGELAYVVRDMDGLTISIMEFVLEYGRKKIQDQGLR